MKVTAEDRAGRRWLKAELHAHCNLDPSDYWFCAYSAEEIIAEAARLGYEVLAITCHDRDVWTRDLARFAERLGLVLIPGMEAAVAGRHVLLYNFRTGPENLDSFEKIRARSGPETLVVAPHPFFPASTCIGRFLESNSDVFDAIEMSGFHAPGLDFNRRARKAAILYGKPLVGNSDAHFLWQLNRTFTWIDSEPGVTEILRAVREGRVRVESAALSYPEVLSWWGSAIWQSALHISGGRFRFRPALPDSRPSSRQ